MSSHGGSTTMVVPVGTDPVAWRTREEQEAAARPLVEQARAGGLGLAHVRGYTRSGWASALVEELLRRHPLSALAFLTHSGQFRIEGDYGTRWMTLLQGAYLDRAARELRELLDVLRDNAGVAAQVDPLGVIEEEELLDELASDLVTDYPSGDPRVLNSDEGIGTRYFVVWLKSVLAVLESARRQGMAVLHVVDEPV